MSSRRLRLVLPLLFVGCVVLFTGCAARGSTKAKPQHHQAGHGTGHKQHGIASWYGSGFKRTASGERYNQNSMTAAHRTLPFGTKVRVTSVRTKRSVVVRINNRGPYIKGRIIDLSRAAAAELKMLGSGIAKVEVEVLERPAVASAISSSDSRRGAQ